MSNEAQQPDSPTQGNRSPVVLFDGGCPLCSREIRHYRRLRGADRIDWVDISRPETRMPIGGIDRATAMARFHVRDASGRWHTGAFGFAELWSHLAAYRHLSRLLRAARLLPLLDRLYGRFARWRQQNRCDAETCGVPHTAHPERIDR